MQTLKNGSIAGHMSGERGTPPKVSLDPWEWPQRLWARLHIDHAGPFMGHIFLILVDAYSKWTDSHIVSST